MIALPEARYRDPPQHPLGQKMGQFLTVSPIIRLYPNTVPIVAVRPDLYANSAVQNQRQGAD
jgi:hypothetical protein